MCRIKTIARRAQPTIRSAPAASVAIDGLDAMKKALFGQASKLALSDVVFGRQVSIEWVKRDRYNRIIGKVLVAGRDAGLQQLRTGMAWHYKQYQAEQMPIDRIEYAAAESAARTTCAWGYGGIQRQRHLGSGEGKDEIRI